MRDDLMAVAICPPPKRINDQESTRLVAQRAMRAGVTGTTPNQTTLDPSHFITPPLHPFLTSTSSFLFRSFVAFLLLLTIILVLFFCFPSLFFFSVLSFFFCSYFFFVSFCLLSVICFDNIFNRIKFFFPI